MKRAICEMKVYNIIPADKDISSCVLRRWVGLSTGMVTTCKQ